jgi:protein-serine/threonine kinase
MSRNVSAASVNDQRSPIPGSNLHEATHADHPPPAPSAATRTSRSSSATGKPAMLGAIGEKKSFFHKMFHHEGKDKHDKLDVPSSDGRASPRNVSPNSPNRDGGAYSPPLTPGASDSDRSRPPSRAPSVKRGTSDHHDPHAQPPTDGRTTPSLQRRLSGRSASHGSTGPGNVAAPAPVPGPAVKKPEAARTPSIFGKKEDGGGTKFTLKDLVGLGDNGPKLNRRPSAAGSGKGSDRGSTKGSERDYGDNGSTASLLKKYGICDKAAIGKGATAVVRLAHKWDRREEKLYAVKVSSLR